MENRKKSSGQDTNLKLYRVHQIDEIIRNGSYPNKTTLAKKLEVSERTIARDLEYIRDFYNAPLEFDFHRNGFYYTKKDFFIKYVSLSEGELFSISLFDRLLEQYRNTPLESQLKTIFQKITSSLPDKVQVDSSFLSNEVTYITDPLPQIDQSVFNEVTEALKTGTTLEIEYKSLTEKNPIKRQIDCYNIVCKRSSWYVVAFCHLKNEIRVFSLTRISNVKKCNAHYEIPPKFNLKDYIDPYFGVWANDDKKSYKVRILCKDYLATIATEQKFHEGQETIQNPDGTVEVAFVTNQLIEARKLVLGFGESAVVLAPDELKEMVKDAALKIAMNY